MSSVSLLPPDRVPNPLREPARWRARSRRVLARLVLAALLLLPLALYGYSRHHRGAAQPSTVSEVRLVGPRGPARLGVDVLLDVSGSFAGYASIRREALADIMSWSGSNLRPDDELTVIAFYDHAVVQLPTTRVADLPGVGGLADVILDDDKTAIQPALRLTGRSVHRAIRQTVVVVTDTLVVDADRAAIDTEMRRLGADTMTLIVPQGGQVIADWARAFSYEQVVTADSTSPGKTSLAIAHAIAHATGQGIQTVRTH